MSVSSSGTKAVTGLYGGRSVTKLEKAIQKRDGQFEADFSSYRLCSRFQRIFSASHQRGVGFEAFLRAIDGNGNMSNANDLFTKAANEEDLIQLDRMRLLLHVKNFAQAGMEDRWLFINLHSKVMLGRQDPDLEFLQEVLEHTGVPAHHVVVALREHQGNYETVLSRTIEGLKKMGCLVLFDDFGGDSANLDRLWRLQPDIVKLDRDFLENANKDSRAKRMLFKLISLIHASSSLVLVEKIETEEESFVAMRLHADFLQGRFWGDLSERPVRRPDNTDDEFDENFQIIRKRFDAEFLEDDRRHNLEMANFTSEFMDCAWAIADGESVKRAAKKLLKMDRVERVYLLDNKGIQVSENIFPAKRNMDIDLRYKPMADTKGATWQRRTLFQNAMCKPGVVNLSKPYRSNTSMNVCTTLSITVNKDDTIFVLCCDLKRQENVFLD
ncbi:MAG: EAL domain-containing protein [Magnetococcales bacterium]|nr:EAL domain-containing protein [Magnetococcales bacterium]